jgi:hypothetical protein
MDSDIRTQSTIMRIVRNDQIQISHVGIKSKYQWLGETEALSLYWKTYSEGKSKIFLSHG